jgi:hypothetical protein
MEYVGQIAGIDFWLEYVHDGHWRLVNDLWEIIGVYKSRASALRAFRRMEKEVRK